MQCIRRRKNKLDKLKNIFQMQFIKKYLDKLQNILQMKFIRKNLNRL